MASRQGRGGNEPRPTLRVSNMGISEREIEDWATWMRAAGRPQSTIGLRTYHIRRVMRDLDATPWAVETEDLLTYLAGMNWAAETRRAYRASLRSFYEWAMACGRCTRSPAASLPPITPPRGQPRPVPDMFYRTALHEAGPRERLMIELAAVCGLRRGEISRVRREDVEPDLLGWSLRVSGKGGHVRRVPLPDDLARRLLAADPGWLFPSPASSGPLTAAHVGKLVSALLPKGWTCHTLRHRCATVAYAVHRDLRAVQDLLGHAKPETTSRYTQVPADAVRAAVMAAAG
jgi:integrase/recombinase XerC